MTPAVCGPATFKRFFGSEKSILCGHACGNNKNTKVHSVIVIPVREYFKWEF